MATVESTASQIGHINLNMKRTGKPGAGKPHAGFDEAGAGNGLLSTAPVLDPTKSKSGGSDLRVHPIKPLTQAGYSQTVPSPGRFGNYVSLLCIGAETDSRFRRCGYLQSWSYLIKLVTTYYHFILIQVRGQVIMNLRAPKGGRN